MKPKTNYVCPKQMEDGNVRGHSGVYTGSYPDEQDRKCVCGEILIEEDQEQWRLTFEAREFGTGPWITVSVVRSKHAATTQWDGLQELISKGEPIRNVKLVKLDDREDREGQDPDRAEAGP